jgi:K+-sensing histidine kinase KdpD
VGRIIKDHQGTTRVEKTKPMGARFIVELPITVDGERPEGGHAEADVIPTRDTQTQT